MATLERPFKEGSVRTYQAKVTLGFPDILASEADADHDTIYAAWNAGIDTSHLVEGAVTTGKIADGAVTSIKIADATIVGGDIANLSIWGDQKLIDKSVTAHGKIIDGTIFTPQLADGAVTSAKILDGTIAATDIADGAVTLAKLGLNAPLAYAAKTTSAVEASIQALASFCGVSAIDYRGGHLLIAGNSSGWVAGSDVPSRIDLQLRVNNGLEAISVSYMTQAVTGTVPWDLSCVTVTAVPPGTYSIQLWLGRTAGALDWRHIYSNLLVIGFA